MSSREELEKKFVKEALGAIADMPDSVLHGWVQNPLELCDRVFKAFDYNCFEVWQKLPAPAFSSLNEALESVREWGEPQSLNLTQITPHDIGFSKDPERRLFLNRARQFGFGLCPVYVAPLLRVNSTPHKEDFLGRYIASEPIDIGGGETSNFWLRDISGFTDSSQREQRWFYRFDAVDAAGDKKLRFDSKWIFVKK